MRCAQPLKVRVQFTIHFLASHMSLFASCGTGVIFMHEDDEREREYVESGVELEKHTSSSRPFVHFPRITKPELCALLTFHPFV